MPDLSSILANSGLLRRSSAGALEDVSPAELAADDAFTGTFAAVVAVPTVRYVAGGWFAPPGTPSTSASHVNNVLYAAPISVIEPVTIDKVGVGVTVAGEAGSTLRVGIYDTLEGLPNALLGSVAPIAADAVATPEPALALTLTPGVYWLAAVVQGAPTTRPTLRSVSGTGAVTGAESAATALAGSLIGYQKSSVSGALPASWGSSLLAAGVVPRVAVHVAA